jgi:hemoglobin
MRTRHFPFTIDEKARETWLLCLWHAFDEAKFPAAIRREYWDWMEAFSARMINRRTMKAQPTRFAFEGMLARDGAARRADGAPASGGSLGAS